MQNPADLPASSLHISPTHADVWFQARFSPFPLSTHPGPTQPTPPHSPPSFASALQDVSAPLGWESVALAQQAKIGHLRRSWAASCPPAP